ncbi:MAG TPA: hypothetical protein VFE51_27130 [Verrucomicrobiae bacterium]|nr:hypothetical protein [Verrucomicrobiae bacterium]
MLKSSIVPFVTALALAVSIAACSKKQPAPAPVAQTETEQTNAAPAEAPQADATPAAPSGPVFDTSQFSGDPKQAMAEADAAFRQREYEKAVRTMLAVQQAQLNAQQAEAARQQMIALQRNLANAAASGDPNAVQAAQILRAAHSH